MSLNLIYAEMEYVMTETTAAVIDKEPETPKKKVNAPIDFLRANLPTIPNTRVIVREISPHWFRVRYWKEEETKSFLKNIVWVADRMYEVSKVGSTYRLIDRSR